MAGHPSAHILVVDDEETIRITLEILLRRCGYTVQIAADGTAALGMLERQGFDLLLLDLKMPGLSGIELAQHAHVMYPNMHILILTGSNPIEGTAESQQIERFAYILKTASPQEVLARVAEMLAR